jgi:hypothetical protein
MPDTGACRLKLQREARAGPWDTGGLRRFGRRAGIPLACAAEPPVEAHAADANSNDPL